MSISIPEEKITNALIDAYMKHRRGPEGDLIWQEHFQELADILIKHGIVSPPNHDLLEALECLKSWVIQHGCKCGHPVCDVCQETIIAEKVIEEAKGGAE